MMQQFVQYLLKSAQKFYRRDNQALKILYRFSMDDHKLEAAKILCIGLPRKLGIC